MELPPQSKRAAKREAKRVAWKTKKLAKQHAAAAAAAEQLAAPKKKKPHQKTVFKQEARKRARAALDVDASDAYHIAFDVSFASTMVLGELNSMVRQIRTCHDDNLLKGKAAAVHLCGLAEATEKVFAKIPIWNSWTATKHAASVADVFAGGGSSRGNDGVSDGGGGGGSDGGGGGGGKHSGIVAGSAVAGTEAAATATPEPLPSALATLPPGGLPVCFLSPDADEVLEDVEVGVVYAIGGIVDRCRSVNMTKDWAHRHQFECKASVLRALPNQHACPPSVGLFIHNDDNELTVKTCTTIEPEHGANCSHEWYSVTRCILSVS